MRDDIGGWSKRKEEVREVSISPLISLFLFFSFFFSFMIPSTADYSTRVRSTLCAVAVLLKNVRL